ncbi:MAG: tetratricopeptide repeat protein [Deltaproteobacteria bacterium]|nr:tetratricopeptide repeat protein [Deltaproteobacteria bacterium]
MEKAKNVDEYIASQKAALQSNPDCGTNRYNLAVALMGKKEYDAAEKEFLKAVDSCPTLAEAYVQLGGIALQRGDMDSCLAYNQQSVKVRAGFAEGHGNVGFIQLQKGNIDEAITALQKAITYNSNFLQAYTTLANAYLMKGLIDESIKANLKAIKLEPMFSVAHNNLAIAYLEKEEYKKAIEHCDKALELGFEVASQIMEEIKKHRA